MIFRHSKISDISSMVQIAEDAKALLKSQKINQWQRGTYPDEKLFIQDVHDSIGYVVEKESDVVAMCAVTFTDEACYREITDGKWLTKDDTLYATIHRSAVARSLHGNGIIGFLFNEVAKLAKSCGAESIRIDTHPENMAMQRALAKAGFEKCGQFYLTEGDEAGDLRYGYEKRV